jgi:hypothetical protein
LKKSVRTIIAVAGMLAAGSIAGLAAAPADTASNRMPASRQNALVQQYCAVCHNAANPTGGLSLDTFDAASPDPGVAAMMVSKLKGGAMSASGQAMPDKATLDALVTALTSEAAGASAWTVTRAENRSTQPPVLTASTVQQVPSAAHTGDPDLYRLTLTCRLDTHQGQIQLSWAPGDISQPDQVISVSPDRKTPSSFRVYKEEGAAVLYATKVNLGTPKLAVPLPAETLTVRDLFPGESVDFSFGSLAPSVRQPLASCFAVR